MRRDKILLRITWRRYRLLVYAGLIGIVGGLGAQLFVWPLDLGKRVLLGGIAGYIAPEAGVSNPSPESGPWGVWLIPVATTLGGLLCGLLVYTFAPEADGHGTDAAVAAFHYLGGRMRPIVPLIKTLASAVTIGSGGAAGREGPTAQIAVGVGSIFADLLKLPDGERRIIVLAGMAAGLSGIFRSPLGMAIFAVEILYAGLAFEPEGGRRRRDPARGTMMVPHGDTTLLEGDSFILAGDSEACTAVRDSVAGKGTLGAD